MSPSVQQISKVGREQIIRNSNNRWGETVATEVAVSPTGEWCYEHTCLALQTWRRPLSVRSLQGPGGWRELGPGARLWLPGEMQHYQWRKASRTNIVVLTGHQVEQALQRPYDKVDFTRWRGRDFSSSLVVRLVEAIFEDISHQSPAGPLAVDSLVTALIAYMAAGPDQVLPQEAPTKLSQKQFVRVLQFVEAHLAEPLRVGRLAQEACCTPRQLSQAFRRRQGMLPHQYVLQRRVHCAVALIDSGHMTLAQVAAEVGFADQSQMTKAFREVMGTTPGRVHKRLHSALGD